MGQSFFYFGKSPSKFARVFSTVGRIEENYVWKAIDGWDSDGNEPLADMTARAIAA
jgi:hypothetical protein